MLSIRMQRLGRKGHPVYRVVVQDSRQSPDSGKYVALLGNYDPHTKTVNLTKDKAEFYLKNGAQPSDRVISLFKAEKIALPDWVTPPTKQERKIRNPEKLRRNRPAGSPAPEKEEAEAASEDETPAAEQPVDNTGADEAAADTPADTTNEVAEAENSVAAEETASDEPPQEAENPAEPEVETEETAANPEEDK